MKWFRLMMLALILAGCAAHPMASRPMPRQAVDVYAPDGQRLGYGYIQDDQVEMFRPDGSRWFHGTVGR